MNKYVRVRSQLDSEESKLELNVWLVKTQKQALDASIEKWSTIIKLIECNMSPLVNEGGAESCGLCYLYHSRENGDCHKCPVYKKTKETDCKGTPYRDYSDEKQDLRRPAILLKHAKRELTFLQSLKSKKVTRDR